MTAGGWIFMLGSIAFVVGLLCFCYYRVLTHPGPEANTPARQDLDTHDQDT